MEDGRYSSHDIADIHYIYGLCDGNANRAVREYVRRYPNRQTPHARTFIRIHHRLAENGIRHPADERARLISPLEEEEILHLITENPKMSVRLISIRLDERYSPDLTPLDLFLWGTMKQKVYVDVPNTREELIRKIIEVGNELRNDKAMIRRSTQHVSVRATACLQHQGGHFEQWL
nr:unnamed protein product [Callosobruchus chinensis]